MKRVLQTVLCGMMLTGVSCAHAQFYKRFYEKGSISVGGTGQFTTQLTNANGSAGTVTVVGPGGGTYTTTASNQQQYTTNSAGFVSSLQFHPVAWAGVEVNYGFTHYSERYAFTYATATPNQGVSVPTNVHEATAAYQFHPKHIPFQPFVNIGGGALDFAPNTGQYQWRTAGLLEMGFDLPTHSKHIGFRIAGRSLYYRAPNFNTAAISTREWRVTEEPSVSTYYRF